MYNVKYRSSEIDPVTGNGDQLKIAKIDADNADLAVLMARQEHKDIHYIVSVAPAAV